MSAELAETLARTAGALGVSATSALLAVAWALIARVTEDPLRFAATTGAAAAAGCSAVALLAALLTLGSLPS